MSSIVVPTSFIQQTSPPTYKGFTTSGLDIYLNANSLASYSGSGSIWYDLSGNGRNAALTGSVGFYEAPSGSVRYMYMPGGTGSVANITVSSTIGASNGSGSVTFGGWCRVGLTNSMTGSGGYGYVPMHSYGVSSISFSQDGISTVIENTTIENSLIHSQFQNPTQTAFPRTTDGYFYNYNNRWIHLMTQWFYVASGARAENVNIYVNGTYQNTLRGDNGDTGTVGGDKRIRAGSFTNFGSTTTNYLAGNFATIEAYGRLLTSDEIYGNFYVSKSFYGY